MRCKPTGLTRKYYMDAYLSRETDPDNWKAVNEFAQAKMVTARNSMIRQSARMNAKIVATVMMKVMLPVPKNSGTLKM